MSPIYLAPSSSILLSVEINVTKKKYIVIGFESRAKYYEEQLDCCKIDKHNEEQLYCCKIDKNNEEQLDCCRISSTNTFNLLYFRILVTHLREAQ